MRIPTLLALATSAAFIPAGAPQAQTVPDPDPFDGIPAVSLNLPGAAAAAATPVETAPAPPPVVRVGPPPSRAPHRWPERGTLPIEAHDTAAPPHVPAPPRVRTEVRRDDRPMHGPAPHRVEIRNDVRPIHGPGPHHGRRFNVQRINRGGFVPHMWWGPHFIVHNWPMYGFPQPFHGGRWIRYYDDALLIDRRGRVHDGRYGWDWSRDRDRWSYRDGVPIYVGDGDFDPRERDYDRGDYSGRHHDEPACDERCDAPGPYPGYGYGYYGPVVVTETTVTTTGGDVDCDCVEYRSAPRRQRVVRRMAPPPPPPPYPGERG